MEQMEQAEKPYELLTGVPVQTATEKKLAKALARLDRLEKDKHMYSTAEVALFFTEIGAGFVAWGGLFYCAGFLIKMYI